MGRANEVLTGLSSKIRDQERRAPVRLTEFMEHMAARPDLVLRNVFQRMYDMVISSVGKGTDEYMDDPESIHYVSYDCESLFVEGVDHPFFADRLFANRLVNHFATFRHGAQQNRIYIFEGPHGSGKSTFLNNLLMKFEQYSKTPEGCAYEIVWRLDRKALNVTREDESFAFLSQLMSLAHDSPFLTKGRAKIETPVPVPVPTNEFLEVACPSHDHPLLVIPREHRREMLENLIEDEEFKKKLFSHKQFEWVFRGNPCTICLSLYQTLLDILGSPAAVFDMAYVRRFEFNRRLGQGISVFNPGDRMPKVSVLTNEILQGQVNTLLRDSNRVKYIFSRYANTNNGVYSLMDVKGHNKERFANLHGIISEEIHKVEDIEENVNSLFLVLMNPEDRENIAGAQSFTDRITSIKMPYVLDYNTEVKIYKNIFGDQITKKFLPRVLENFAKVIISSRLKEISPACLQWIAEPGKYSLFCDGNLQLLKMDIYAGSVPEWLNQEDRKRFTSKRRRALINESETEGDRGFSGRDSIKIFNEFTTTYGKNGTLINMPALSAYFGERRKDLAGFIPAGFLQSLLDSYNYAVLQEMKECLYYFNKDRVSMDIQNYIYATNFDPGRVEKCHYTGELIDVSEAFFQGMERQILGAGAEVSDMRSFRKEVQQQYASKTLTQEIMLEGKPITATTVFNSLLERYTHSLKEKVMDPFVRNDNFRSAIKDFGSEVFKTYDKRVREEVTFLMKNLQKKYSYSAKGAKDICIYTIDNDLAGKFSAS